MERKGVCVETASHHVTPAGWNSLNRPHPPPSAPQTLGLKVHTTISSSFFVVQAGREFARWSTMTLNSVLQLPPLECWDRLRLRLPHPTLHSVKGMASAAFVWAKLSVNGHWMTLPTSASGLLYLDHRGQCQELGEVKKEATCSQQSSCDSSTDSTLTQQGQLSSIKHSGYREKNLCSSFILL